jgi:hypothetical protein
VLPLTLAEAEPTDDEYNIAMASLDASGVVNDAIDALSSATVESVASADSNPVRSSRANGTLRERLVLPVTIARVF